MKYAHPNSSKRVCIVGVGYIGLPTALLAAHAGFDVTAYDTDAQKIALLKSGNTSICEQDLVTMLTENTDHPRLKFSTHPASHADFYIIAVPTPFLESKQADLSYVWNAIHTIAPLLKQGSTVIIESTVPVFLTNGVAIFLEQTTGLIIGKDLFVAHCPERVLPGNMLFELINNARVIGGVTPACTEKACEFYAPFVQGTLHKSTAKAAEIVKLVENSSRDVQIALANQVDQICTAANVDSREVIDLANKHPRVKILEPGCGVGGHCIAVDPFFLINTFPQATQLFATARKINDERPELVFERIKVALERMLEKSATRQLSIGIWGLAFKPNVDDCRQSPALEIAKKLTSWNNSRIKFHAVEPNVHPHTIQTLGFVAEASADRSLELSDGIIVLVKHNTFKSLSLTLLEHKVIFDACGLLYEINKTKTQQEISTAHQTPSLAPSLQ